MEREKNVAILIETVDVDIVLGRWGDGRDIEGDISSPDSAWHGQGGSGATRWWVGLVVDLCAEEEALELKVSDSDWMSGQASDGEDGRCVELGRIGDTLGGAVEEKLEVLLAFGLSESQWSGDWRVRVVEWVTVVVVSISGGDVLD